MSASIRQELMDLGLEISDGGKHYKLTHFGDGRLLRGCFECGLLSFGGQKNNLIHLEGFFMAKLDRIDIDDQLVFSSRGDVMESCFAIRIFSVRRGAIDTYDGGYAWLPKEEIVGSNGKIKSGAISSNWKNHFEDDKYKVISWLYDDEYPTEARKEPVINDDPSPLHCFWCSNPKVVSYIYEGTFLYDKNVSTPRYRVYRRIRTNLDLTLWNNRETLENYDFMKCGIPAFEEIYLNHDYRYQRKKMDVFLQTCEKVNDDDKLIEETNQIVRNLPVLKMDKLRTGLLKAYRDLFGDDNQSEILCKIDGIDKIAMDIHFLPDNVHSKYIRDHDLDQQILIGKILTLFNGYFYLYSLSENETEYYLKKLHLHFNMNDDLTEKHNLLYFWKQCNWSMDEWSVYKYYCFLKFVFGEFQEDYSINERERSEDNESTIDNDNQTLYVSDDASKDNNDNWNTTEILCISEQDMIDSEREEGIIQESVETNIQKIEPYFDYVPKPETRKQPNDVSGGTAGTYPRDPVRRVNALTRANYTCEFDQSHVSFISRRTNKRYMETHHLIPLEYWKSFKNSLDVEANIVCLCSNCHNEIHYGKDAEKLIEALFKKRISELKLAGIGIEITVLKNLYNGTYIHMQSE